MLRRRDFCLYKKIDVYFQNKTVGGARADLADVSQQNFYLFTNKLVGYGKRKCLGRIFVESFFLSHFCRSKYFSDDILAVELANGNAKSYNDGFGLISSKRIQEE